MAALQSSGPGSIEWSIGALKIIIANIRSPMRNCAGASFLTFRTLPSILSHCSITPPTPGSEAKPVPLMRDSKPAHIIRVWIRGKSSMDHKILHVSTPNRSFSLFCRSVFFPYYLIQDKGRFWRQDYLSWLSLLLPLLSDPSYQALKAADELASHFSAGLELIHAVTPIPLHPTGMAAEAAHLQPVLPLPMSRN
jgi:hypothetical protein